MNPYNLTDNQKKLARWIVGAVRVGKLDEQFHIAWSRDAMNSIVEYEGEPDTQSKALFTRGNVNALQDSDLLSITTQTRHGMRCALRGRMYEAVDSDFGASTERTTKAQPPSTVKEEQDALDIFISHSGKDDDIGKPLVELLKHAFTHKPKIRYTSADETGLDPGAPVDQSLKKQVRQSRTFIGLLTPNSLKSVYVLFELGARWGMKDEIIVLLAKGASRDMLFGPLRQIHAIDCNARALFRMLEKVETDLRRELDKPSAFQEYLEKLIKANAEAESEEEDPSVAQLQDKITQLEREIERLEVKLGAEDFSQGDDLFTVHYYYYVAGQEKEFGEHPISWNQIIKNIGPQILQYELESTIQTFIGKLLKELGAPIPEEGLALFVTDYDFQTILIQLKGQGLIERHQRNRSWRLSDQGDRLLVKLRAIRKLEGSDYARKAWYGYIINTKYIRDNKLMSSEEIASYVDSGLSGLQILEKLLEKLEKRHVIADKNWTKAMADLKEGKRKGLTDHEKKLLGKKNTRWRMECENIKSIKLEIGDLIEHEKYKQVGRDS